MRKYNNFAPIGLKSGFVDVIHQFDIEISLICGFAPQMGDESPVFGAKLAVILIDFVYLLYIH